MVSNQRVLLMVAAESFEFTGLLRRCPAASQLDLPVRFAKEVRLSGRTAILLADGPGPRLAARTTGIGIRQFKVEAVVSTGFCGALDPRLTVGGIFVPTRVEAVERDTSYTVLKPSTERRYAEGLLRSADRVVGTAAEKARLAATGASAVEMESGAVAESASMASVPFYCVRVVSDSANEGFSIDLNACRDAEGRFSRPRILAAACRRPFTGWPELIRLQRRSRMASEILGEFLADCRF